jgi:(p)ppGpp synthase/HD superfamily hydrolase
MDLIAKAIMIATQAHESQIDKCGEPYILHPLRVMMNLQSIEDRVVAVLHDVIEDTQCTTKELIGAGIPEILVNAIVSISKRDGEHYDEYLARVKSNAISKRVKIVDIKDNASPSRLYRLAPHTIDRLTVKYSYALKYLEDWQ